MKLDQRPHKGESRISSARASHYFDAEELATILGSEALRLNGINNGYSVLARWDVELIDVDAISVIGVEISVGLHPVEGVHEVDE